MNSKPIIKREQLLQMVSKPLENTGTKAMSPQEVQAQLAVLSGWRHVGEFIEKEYAFSNYHENISFVNRLATMIHAEDHHPELRVTYNRCRVNFNTHSVDGVSINDFICAAKADQIFQTLSQQQQ